MPTEGEDNSEQDGDKDAAAGASAAPPVPRPPPLAPLPAPHPSIRRGVPSSSSSAPPRAPLPPPGVITHAAVPHASAASHPSVIQALSHANHKHLPHIAPSPGPAPIGHITVHPVARLGALYPQGVSVSQPAVVGHIAHTFAHRALPRVQPPHQAGGGGGALSQQAAALGKATAVLAPHPQLVGQAAVTMVTVPTFPVSTIKLA